MFSLHKRLQFAPAAGSRGIARQLIFVLLTVLPLLASATVPTVPAEELVPSEQHERSTKLIIQIMDRFHYKKVPLDDELSSQILDRYLESLDPNRSFFLSYDIAAFESYRRRLDDALQDAELGVAFEIFRVYRTRLEEAVNYALSLLDEDFDFTVEESYRFDRRDAPWAAHRAELEGIWRKRVKNDVLNLRLSGKKEDEIAGTLRKRYEQLARRTSQLGAEEVFQLFVNAYTLSVEPHTSYYSPRASENFQINMSLSLEGIGAALRTDNEYTLVHRLVTGGPAELSGKLQTGDRIVGVGQDANGAVVDVIGWRLANVVDLIRGPKGSTVRLEILPKDKGPEGPSKVIALVRDKIKLEEQAAKKSVTEIGEDGGKMRIGIIEIPTFYMDFDARRRGDSDYRSTTRDVRVLLEELLEEGVAGIVIDLRGNGGGSLTEATALTGLFIDSGPVVQMRHATGKLKVDKDPEPGIAYSGPLAVLVNRNSASASEIFAGAIQDYRRGIIIGEPTFGKGTVQNMVNLNQLVKDQDTELGRLKVTVAQFFRVNGASTQHRGVVPDIVLPTGFDASEEGERSLDNALPWARVKPVKFEASDIEGLPLRAAKERHMVRVQGDAGFQYLLELARADRENKDLTTVSLLEAERRAEREDRQQTRKRQSERFRAERGLEPLDEDDENADATATSEAIDDVLLEEAANILADFINARSQQPMAEAHPGRPLGGAAIR